MSNLSGPTYSAGEPLRRGTAEQSTPLSIQRSNEYSFGAPSQSDARRASGARRMSARRNSLNIPEDIPAETAAPKLSAPPRPAPAPALRTTAAATPKAADVQQKLDLVAPQNQSAAHKPSQEAPPAPAKKANITVTSVRPAPQPAPQLAVPKPAPAPAPAAAPPKQAKAAKPVRATPVATRAAPTPAPTGTPVDAPAGPAHTVSPEHMTDLRVSTSRASDTAVLCTPQERQKIGAANVDTLCAEKRRLERLSLAITEEIQSREFTESMYALMPRGNQYYEAETCIRRIAGEAFDFSSPEQLQLALQMSHKNARLSEKNSMFAGAMMSLTSLTNTGTVVESLANFQRFYAERKTTMPDTWKQQYVTAMRQIVVGFQSNPDMVLDQFGHHVARLVQHEQLYVALLRVCQGRPLESPAPHLDADWDDDDDESEYDDASSDDNDSSDYSSDSDKYESASDASSDTVVARVPAAHSTHPQATARTSASPAALPPRPSSSRPSMNTFNDTDGRPPSHSPRVNEANRRAQLTPVVGRGAEAAEASTAVRPGAPPAVFKPMPEPMRRSSSAHSDGCGPTRMRDRHQDAYPYPSRGDSPDARPLVSTSGVAPHTTPAPFVPPVPRTQPPLATSPGAPAGARSLSARVSGSGSFDAGYFRQPSQNGASPSHAVDPTGFVLRNQEPLSRHTTPVRSAFSRENSTNAAVTGTGAATTNGKAGAATKTAGAAAPRARAGPAPKPTSAAHTSSAPKPAAKATAAAPRPTPRHATAPPAAEDSLERPERPSQDTVDNDGDVLPPTMSKRQSREKQQTDRAATAAAASAKEDAAPSRGRTHGAAAARPPLGSSNVTPRAPSPNAHRRGVADENSPIPGVPDTVYSQRSPSPQQSRATTPRQQVPR